MRQFLEVHASGRSRRRPVLVDRSRRHTTSPEPRAARTTLLETREPWVVVLAGGEGRRLQSWTTLRDGAVVPKQFCSFRDQRTLLAATLDRAKQITTPDRIVAVVLESHRHWWESDLRELPERNILSQPANRGTAIAILCAVAEIQSRDDEALVAVMPSDHDVEAEGPWTDSIREALAVAEECPSDLVLLGLEPTQMDCEYGLIVPRPRIPGETRSVQTFVEKPSPEAGGRLIRRGALWNSFVFAARGTALLALFESSLPALTCAYLRWLPVVRGDEAMAQLLFEGLPTHDFSREVLQRTVDKLRLVVVPQCGWTDLGTPARLAVWLDRHREAAFWRTHLLPWSAGTGGSHGRALSRARVSPRAPPRGAAARVSRTAAPRRIAGLSRAHTLRHDVVLS